MKGNRAVAPFGVRMSDVIKEALRIAAFKHRRSMNSELMDRLEMSLESDGFLNEARKSLKEARA